MFHCCHASHRVGLTTPPCTYFEQGQLIRPSDDKQTTLIVRFLCKDDETLQTVFIYSENLPVFNKHSVPASNPEYSSLLILASLFSSSQNSPTTTYVFPHPCPNILLLHHAQLFCSKACQQYNASSSLHRPSKIRGASSAMFSTRCTANQC